ncbi:MAG: AsmA family protein [bacterium]
MRKLVFALIGAVFILFIAALAAPMFISADVYKAKLEAEASKALGREVHIASVRKVAFLPNPVFAVEGLTIANSPGMSTALFAEVGAADIGVKLLPLFARNVEVTRFVLTEPKINLEKRADGVVNWGLGTQSTSPKEDNANENASENSNDAVKELKFGDVRLVQGAITFQDHASNQLFTAQNANITLSLASLDKPLTAQGTMTFQNAPAKFELKISTPRSLMNKQATLFKLKSTLENNQVNADFNLGEGELNYTGNLEVDAPTLRSLLATLGMNIEAQTGFNNLFFKGDVNGTATRLSFTNGALRFDDITSASGALTDLAFEWSGPRPKITGQIALSTLDLRPYLPAPPPASIDHKKKGGAFPPWPEDKIDLSIIRSLDAKLTATTDGIILHDMKFGKSDLILNITNGLLDATLKDTSLYSGGGSGKLHINAQGRTPVIQTYLDLTGLNAQTFAQDVLGLNRLQGIGGLKTDLTVRGDSVADFMRHLNGNGTIQLEKGAMQGIDIGKIIRSAAAIVKGFEGGRFNTAALGNAITEARGPSSTTNFSDLTSTYTIQDGILTTNDAILKGPYYRIDGVGTVNFAQQSMRFTFAPTVFDTVEDVTGYKLKLPLQISGTFNDPKIGFDTQGLLRGAVEDKASELLRGQGVDIPEGKSLEDALKDKASDELSKALGFGQKDEKESESSDATNSSDADTATQESEGDPEEAPADEEEAASLEDQVKDKLIGSIFGAEKQED